MESKEELENQAAARFAELVAAHSRYKQQAGRALTEKEAQESQRDLADLHNAAMTYAEVVDKLKRWPD